MNGKQLKQVRENYNDAKTKSSSTTKTINNEGFSMRHREEGQDDVTIERNARKDYDENAAIRAEFSRVESYIAFCQADAKGIVRICGGVVRGNK